MTELCSAGLERPPPTRGRPSLAAAAGARFAAAAAGGADARLLAQALRALFVNQRVAAAGAASPDFSAARRSALADARVRGARTPALRERAPGGGADARLLAQALH